MKKPTKWLLAGCILAALLCAGFFVHSLFGFSPLEEDAISVIGGADGPTAILVTTIP